MPESPIKRPAKKTSTDADESKKGRYSFHAVQSANMSRGIMTPGDEVHLAPNLKVTKMGICYAPEADKEETGSSLDGVQTGTNANSRHDFKRLINGNDSMASVLIVGDDAIVSGFRNDLESAANPSFLLSCVQMSAPSLADALNADFLLFLVQMDVLDSLKRLSDCVMNLGLPLSQLCIRSAIIKIPSPEGAYKNIVTEEQFRAFVVQVQMPFYTFMSSSRELRTSCATRLYELIQQSCTGSNIPLLINWGLTCPVHNSDTLMS